jgi:hypothetical protein
MADKYPTFPKIPRWNREVVLTEKLDGTNGLVAVCPPESNWQDQLTGRTHPPRFRILPDGWQVAAGSRKRWLNPNSDNFGFAQWVWDHAEDLASLGPGCHYGEWYGKGIQRGYGLPDRRFALFNVSRWEDPDIRPPGVEVVTVLSRCDARELSDVLGFWLKMLESEGSSHVPGFARPEGVVLYHTAGGSLYKVTLEGDEAKTPEGFVVKSAGGQRDIGLSPEQQAAEALNNWTNKNWQPRPVGVDQFVTTLAA